MGRRTPGGSSLRSALLAASVALAALTPGCATDGAYVEGGVYGGFYYDDPWYWAGCCVDPPDAIGPPPPHAEHPIAKPPPVRPSHPIAAPRPMPSPRPAAMPRGGGGRR